MSWLRSVNGLTSLMRRCGISSSKTTPGPAGWITWLSNQALWEIARRTMSPEDQAAMAELVRQQGERTLTETEQSRLDALRREYGRITLMKARAYALLSLRGGEPLLGQV